jgi:hypothetical protein
MRYSPHRHAFILLRPGGRPGTKPIHAGMRPQSRWCSSPIGVLRPRREGEAEPGPVTSQCGRPCRGTRSFRCRMCRLYVKTPLRVRVQILRRPFDDCAIGCGGRLNAPGVLSGCDCNPSCVIRGILVPLVTRARRFRGINDCAPPDVVFDTTPAVATHLFHDVLHALLTAALPDPRRMSGIANTT